MKIVLMLLNCILMVIFFGCNRKTDMPDTSAKKTSGRHLADSIINKDQIVKSVVGKTAPDYNLLAGDWVRTDGGYIIKIRNIFADGTMMAEYYNPNPINVAKSAWETDGINLYLMVELRDVNYPGSTYTLQYFPEQDKLSGIYFQAVEGSTYEVAFDRKIH